MKPRGSGSVYQRGSVWWFKYYDRNGRAHRESSRSRRKADAEKKLRKRISEIADGRRVLGCDAERTTFEDLRRFIVDDYRLNGRKSLDSVHQSFRALARWFAGFRAHEISYECLEHYAAERIAEGRARATVKRELVLLHRAFVLAERAERARVPRFPTVSVHNARSGFFEREQWLAVRRHLSAPIRDVGDFAYLTGWRVMEILTLQWRQVDFASGAVRLDPGSTKNATGRVFPFSHLFELKALLERRRRETKRLLRLSEAIVPWVFHDAKGEPLFWGKRPKKSLRRAWHRACQSSGNPGKLLHDFRRTAVRNLVRAGVGQNVAMELVGQKSDSIFRRYDIVATEDLVDGVERLAGYLEHGQ